MTALNSTLDGINESILALNRNSGYVLTFGATSLDPGSTTVWLRPGGPAAVATSGVIKLAVPLTDTETPRNLRAVMVYHNTPAAVPVTYDVRINGVSVVVFTVGAGNEYAYEWLPGSELVNLDLVEVRILWDGVGPGPVDVVAALRVV
jgi:hypothetical protein